MVGESTSSRSAVSSDPLWQRIESFDLDQPGTALTFSERLRRDHAWTTGHGSLVVGEYRRFLYLLATSPQMLTPSEDVDEAWHLHMTYTRSYWDELCAGVLGRPLHHVPTEGGPEEEARFRAAYGQTLERYAAVFGSPPPAEVWPDPETRFSREMGHQTVRQSDFWIIPRYWSPEVSKVIAHLVPVLAAVAVGAAGLAIAPDDILPLLFIGVIAYWAAEQAVGLFLISPNAHAMRREVGANRKPFVQSSGSGCGGSCGGCGGCGG